MLKCLKNCHSKVSLFIWNHRKLFSIMLMILCFADLYARAGGGNNYRSSSSSHSSSFSHSSSSSSSSSSGSGSIFDLFYLLYLAFKYPVIGIPLLIFGIIFIYFAIKNSATNATINKSIRIQNDMAIEKIVSELKAKDPAFNIDSLIIRFKSAFTAIQDAWSNQNLSKVKNFISDGIYERFSLQFREQKDRNFVNKVKNIQIRECTPVFLVSDKVYETLTVRITASAVDYYENLKTGELIDGDKDISSIFTEYWSFIRKTGTKTVNGNGLIEGYCPNCGAPLTLNSHVKCEACGSLIKSGQFDWVLAEITQADEWSSEVQASAPGVKDMQAADPDFSIQNLEDKTSVIFWRYIETLRTGSIDPVRKMATDKFCSSDMVKTEKNQTGEDIIPADCAVGSVDTLGILMEDAFDTAFMEVRWAGAKLLKSDLTRVSLSSLRSSIFVLIRKHSITAPKMNALSSAHCPNCGAPVSDDTSDACVYCNTVLNTGSHDWVLDKITYSYDVEVKNALAKLISSYEEDDSDDSFSDETEDDAPRTGKEMVSWMIVAMLADGVLDNKERKLLFDYALRSGVGTYDIKKLIESAQAGILEAPEPETPEEGKEWLKAMIYMAYADGVISDSELKAITMLGNKIGMDKKEISQLLNEIKQKIYRDSKAFLKEFNNK